MNEGRKTRSVGRGHYDLPVVRAGFGLFALLLVALATWPGLVPSRVVRALGANDGVDVRRVVVHGGGEAPRARAAERIAWEVRKRTSIETALNPSEVRLDDPSIYRTPFLYWPGDRAFNALSDAELTGLRRFVEYGGFLLLDDASPEGGGFDESVRRELGRAFPSERFVRLSPEHTIFRSFYLLSRPMGRLADPDYVEAIVHAGRVAVVYSRHDLGAAWAFDGRSQSANDIPAGQREGAVRFGVNLVMYALCLDYKDDQVHAPFILRRRGGRP
jgi:hypothetical protein